MQWNNKDREVGMKAKEQVKMLERKLKERDRRGKTGRKVIQYLFPSFIKVKALLISASDMVWVTNLSTMI